MAKKRKKRTKPRMIKRFLVKVYPAVYGRHCIKRYNVVVGRNETIDMDEPYILLSNHVTNFDGLFLQYIINKPISYVINDKVFRVPTLRFLLKHLDLIAKKKFSSDIQTVRDIFSARNRGEIICIFAEGRRNWDGQTADIVDSTFTLIKSIKMPVLVANIKGGSASRPRWHDKKQNKGTVVIDITKSLSTTDIRSMTLDEIKAKVTADMFNDDYKFAADSGYTYESNVKAEGMERLIFVCPKCESISTLSSNGNTISCTCGYHADFTEKFSFGGGRFQSLVQWNDWQKEFLQEYIKQSGEDDVIFQDEDIALFSAKGYEKLREIDHGKIYATKEMLVFEGENEYQFYISDIKGASIQSNNAFEFDVNKVTYRFLLSGRDNAFKYQLLTKMLN